MTDKAKIAAAGAMNNVRTAIDSAKRIGFTGHSVGVLTGPRVQNMHCFISSNNGTVFRGEAECIIDIKRYCPRHLQAHCLVALLVGPEHVCVCVCVRACVHTLLPVADHHRPAL